MMSYPHIGMHFNGNAHCGKRQRKEPCVLWTCILDSKVLQTYIICSQSYFLYIHAAYLHMLCCNASWHGWIESFNHIDIKYILTESALIIDVN